MRIAKYDKDPDECVVCFEEGRARSCCGSMLCDHCYASRGQCPVCGVGIMHGKPVFIKHQPVEEAQSIDEVDSEQATSHEEIVRQREAEAKKEHMECRICLDPGKKRKCCGGCFCDACYYRKPTCPACRKPTANRGLGAWRVVDPGFWPVLIGAGVTATFAGAAVGLVALGTAIEQSDIPTLHGFTCYGVFPKCDRFACVEIRSAPWEGELTMTTMATWTKCDADTTASVRGSTCVYDWDLWVQSGHSLGYDFCVGSIAKDQHTQIEGDEARGASFADGAYIFEDTFELGQDDWKNATSHKSNSQGDALWQYIDGARVDDACGAHNPGGTALHFQGPDSREAVTQPLDVRHGGFLNFRVKLAPGQFEDSGCRANYGRSVSVYYAADHFVGWRQFHSLESSRYARGSFSYVSLAIPSNASTTATQFKISQPTFNNEGDHWALDDVTVFRNFEPGWRHSQEFDTIKKASRQDVAVAQCCFHTDQCERRDDFKAKRSEAEFRRGCDDVKDKVVPAGDLKKNMNHDIYRLNGHYLLVSLAGLAALYSSCYACLRTYMITGLDLLPVRRLFDWVVFGPDSRSNKIYVSDEKAHDDWGDEEPHNTDVNLKYVFELKCDPEWQRRFAMATLVPLSAATLWALASSEGIVLYTPLRAYGRDTVAAVWAVPVPSFFVFILACYLDATTVYAVSRHVICLLPRWRPKIHLNMHPDKNCLDVGNPAAPQLHVPLPWMEETSRFTKEECTRLAALYVVTCQPFALVTLGLGGLRLPYDTVDRWLTILVGGVAVARAFAGHDVLIKLVLGLNHVVARSPLMRDHIGAAVRHKRTAAILGYTLALNLVVAAILLPSDDQGHRRTRKLEVFIGFLVVALVVSVYALTLGCLQGLPVTPTFKLTKLDGGLYLTFVHHVSCPCYAHCSECSDMHTRKRIMILFLEDIMTFVALLKGEELDDADAKFLASTS